MAQKIGISTNEIKKPYVFAIHNGLKLDTIVKGIIPSSGAGEINIPVKYKGIPVMGVFSISGQKPMSVIVNSEDFHFSYPQNGSLSFKNSVENDLLYGEVSSHVLDKSRDTYAYAYLKSRNVVLQMAEVIALKQRGRGDLFKQSMVRASALNDVDIDKLYYSNLWYYIIDGMMNLSIGEKGFADDMIRLLAKTKTNKVFIAFVEDLITITNQFGMDEAFDIIIDYVQESGRIKYPQGAIYDAFQMAKIKQGSIAPNIKGLVPALGKSSHKYTMLIFHQPGCENCEQQMKQLGGNYRFYKERGVRVITLSGALTKEEFQKEKKMFPWEDSLCDYKGFAGENFLAYGVVSTPMIYLLNEKGIVLKRFALISDVEGYIRAKG